MTLKEIGFLFFKKLKCHPKNLFSDDASLLINKLADVDN